MCLEVDTKVKPRQPKKNGYCVAWKVLQVDNISPFQRYGYKVGINVMARNYILQKKGKREYFDGENVKAGLHCFLRRCDAVKEIKNSFWFGKTPLKIVKVYYRPEDAIAYGTYEVDCREKPVPSVVVKKLLIKSLGHSQKE